MYQDGIKLLIKLSVVPRKSLEHHSKNFYLQTSTKYRQQYKILCENFQTIYLLINSINSRKKIKESKFLNTKYTRMTKHLNKKKKIN